MNKINLEFDPDFDSTTDQPFSVAQNKNQSRVFDSLPSKTAFWAGALTSLLGAGTIGFIVVLVLFLRGGAVISPRSASASANSPRQVAQAPQPARAPTPSPSDVGGAISVRPIGKDDHIRGSKNAKITLVEYSDLECPFCKRFHPTMQRLVQEYDGKIAWVYRHFPLRQLHSKAAKESEATECAGEQGKFWEYIDKIFEVTPSNDGLDLAQLPILAEQVGLNRKKFEDCLASGKYTAHVSADEQDASSAGGRGTPHTVILTSDGKKIPVSGALPFEQFKSLIDPLL